MSNLSNYLFIYSFTYLSNLSLFLNTIDLLDYLPIYLNIYFSYLFCLFISTFFIHSLYQLLFIYFYPLFILLNLNCYQIHLNNKCLPDLRGLTL